MTTGWGTDQSASEFLLRDLLAFNEIYWHSTNQAKRFEPARICPEARCWRLKQATGSWLKPLLEKPAKAGSTLASPGHPALKDRSNTRVPGMRAVWEGASPSANLMEVKASEAQGRHREVGSEGSVEQTYEPTHRNWISRRQGRTSQRVVTKSISIKVRKRKSSGCVRKDSVLTPGGCPLKDRWNRKVA